MPSQRIFKDCDWHASSAKLPNDQANDAHLKFESFAVLESESDGYPEFNDSVELDSFLSPKNVGSVLKKTSLPQSRSKQFSEKQRKKSSVALSRSSKKSPNKEKLLSASSLFKLNEHISDPANEMYNRSSVLSRNLRDKNAFLIYNELDIRQHGYIDVEEAIGRLKLLFKNAPEAREAIIRLLHILADLKSYIFCRGVIEKDVAIKQIRSNIDAAGLSCPIYSPFRSSVDRSLNFKSLYETHGIGTLPFYSSLHESEGLKEQMRDAQRWKDRNYNVGPGWRVPKKKLNEPMVTNSRLRSSTMTILPTGPLPHLSAPFFSKHYVEKLNKDRDNLRKDDQGTMKEMEEVDSPTDEDLMQDDEVAQPPTKHESIRSHQLDYNGSIPHFEFVPQITYNQVLKELESVDLHSKPSVGQSLHAMKSGRHTRIDPHQGTLHVHRNKNVFKPAFRNKYALNVVQDEPSVCFEGTCAARSESDSNNAHLKTMQESRPLTLEKKAVATIAGELGNSWDDPQHFVLHCGEPPPKAPTAWEDTLRDSFDEIVLPLKRDSRVAKSLGCGSDAPKPNKAYPFESRGLLKNKFSSMVSSRDRDKLDSENISPKGSSFVDAMKPEAFFEDLQIERLRRKSAIKTDRKKSKSLRKGESLPEKHQLKKARTSAKSLKWNEHRKNPLNQQRDDVCTFLQRPRLDPILLLQVDEKTARKKKHGPPKSCFGDFVTGMKHASRAESEWIHHLRDKASVQRTNIKYVENRPSIRSLLEKTGPIHI